mmetsp:Transcript_22598/g.33044  ORF Transcript_22598/g.33044 Transcript_22598/m.33044 type:complete len:1019 (+) Transcript_22598:174-3230(+)|eukprot:CAMPEP_0185023450 /NCGR_PEP_ID=MMETSP1103-20130426/6118_1 /TAXON_ID=36769 /ORGANISM="Paraphysomonas bandaiensis, Strain Caron Lab Isolate" /LENGTH=1018 /DNA_ID=CAMNT_0027556051 /DNA_START=161 /DNA_END=3217 /DNA_ORIENTATION=+
MKFITGRGSWGALSALVILSLASQLHALVNDFQEVFVEGTSQMSYDKPLMSGRGLMTSVHMRFAVMGTPNNDIDVFHRVYIDNADSWTHTATIFSADYAADDYFPGDAASNRFFNTALISTHVAGNVLMVGAFNNDGVATDSGAAYIFSGVWSKWSQQQKIVLDGGKGDDWFGMSVAMNRERLGEGAITCGKCDPLRYTHSTNNTGAVYTYSSKPPMFDRWTQQQLLFPVDTSIARFGYGLSLDRDVLVAAGSAEFNETSGDDPVYDIAFAYWRDPATGVWTEQQSLVASTSVVNYFFLEVEDETIVVGDGQSGGTYAGQVKIYYPDTPRFHEKPSPWSSSFHRSDHKSHGPHWSLRQVLYEPDGGAVDGTFGSMFDLYGNVMAVASPEPYSGSTGFLYFYEREYLGGQWSVQQIISEPEPNRQLWAPSLYGSVAEFTVFDKAKYYTQDYAWDCLIIAMEDAFGDGWDKAQLRAVAPDGSIDVYAPACDSTNPLSFRYCPHVYTDEGLYKFTIEGAEKSKWPWEIQWRVFEEKTGTWYRGNKDTSMDFHWDSSALDFSRRAIHRTLPTNITCPTKCDPKPLPKSSSLSSRELKGKESTASPTISPAPTLAQTDGPNWQYFTMTTNVGDSWFNEEHQGTNYYISDSKGHRLISTGTMCDGVVTQDCWQHLPDGDYVLRVTGDLDTSYASHSWAFCGRVGGASEMLVFRVTNDECDAVAAYTRTSFCEDQLGVVAVADVNLILSGVGTLHEDDADSLVAALISLFPRLKADNVKIARSFAVSSGLDVELQVQLPLSTLGYDPTDPDSYVSAYSDFTSALETYISNGKLRTALQSSETESNIARVVGIHLGMTEILTGGAPSHRESFVLVQDMAEEPAQAESVVEKTAPAGDFDVQGILRGFEVGALYSASGAGYILMAVIILAALKFASSSNGLRSIRGHMTPSSQGEKEDMLERGSGGEEVLIRKSSSPALAIKSLKEKYCRTHNKVEYAVVSTLDDIADGVVDFFSAGDSDDETDTSS